MAAWWTQGGAQLIRQNLTTGAIMYSHCNSAALPVFPTDAPFEFTLAIPPRNGTALTGQGPFDAQSFWASIFYQDEAGRIINYLAVCDPETGKFMDKGTMVVSDAEWAPAPLVGTGLASVLLYDQEGYHLYYHTAQMELHQYTYANNANDNRWAYAGVISKERPLHATISAMWSGNRNQTIVYPKNQENIQISRYFTDKIWRQESFPHPLAGGYLQTANTTNNTFYPIDTSRPINFTLPAYDGTQRSFGMSTDKAYTRNVFYLGTDRRLYHAANIAYVWRLMNNQTETLWPLADEAAGELAIASDFQSSQVRIYYDVGGKLHELRFDKDGMWKPAVALPSTVEEAAAVRPPDDGGEKEDGSMKSGSKGLALGAKVGIAIGATGGVIILVGVIGALLVTSRRKRLSKHSESLDDDEAPNTPTDSIPPSPLSPVERWLEDKEDLDPRELVSGRLAHEMEEQVYSHEVATVEKPREMQ